MDDELTGLVFERAEHRDLLGLPWRGNALIGARLRPGAGPRGDLGPGRIKLGVGPLDFPAERAEAIGVQPHRERNPEAEALRKHRPDRALLTVHHGEHGDGVSIRTIVCRHGQK